jgi:hypothetical protein
MAAVTTEVPTMHSRSSLILRVVPPRQPTQPDRQKAAVMNPRAIRNFFASKFGLFLVFVAVLFGGLLVYGHNCGASLWALKNSLLKLLRRHPKLPACWACLFDAMVEEDILEVLRRPKERRLATLGLFHHSKTGKHDKYAATGLVDPGAVGQGQPEMALR